MRLNSVPRRPQQQIWLFDKEVKSKTSVNDEEKTLDLGHFCQLIRMRLTENKNKKIFKGN